MSQRQRQVRLPWPSAEAVSWSPKVHMPDRSKFLLCSALFALIWCVHVTAALSRDSTNVSTSQRLGVSDVNPRGTTEETLKRFQLYREAGIGILRVDEGLWRALEGAPDTWSMPPELISYYKLAQDRGFQFKAGIGALTAPPSWFFEQHPDAQLVGQTERPNDAALKSNNTISYWYPGLHELLSTKDDRIFSYLAKQGLLRNIRYLVVPGGPAAEPLYPAPWTTSDPNGPPRFWCYDEHAQADFITKAKARYGSLQSANSAWQTSYPDWGSVRIPLPAERPGQMWSDVLTWYRDTKRAFFTWQVSHYDTLRRKYWPAESQPRLLILVPGEHVTTSEWSQAIQTGAGAACVRAMCDSEFLLDTAARAGAAVQYTGLPAMGELMYLKRYIRLHGYSIEFWGENVGNVGVPKELGYEVLSNGLFGQEYIGSNLFAADGRTPSDKFRDLVAEYSWLRSVWEGREDFSLRASDVSLSVGECLSADKDGTHQLCLETDGALVLYEGRRLTWKATPGAGAAADCASAEACKGVFQGDGNLVIYRDSKPIWASGTAGTGASLVFTSKPPYVLIQDRAGRTVWTPDQQSRSLP